MKTTRILLYFLPFLISFSGWGKTHLLILSGQSNMAGLNPALSFTPTVKKLLAPDDVIVVKSAQGGQPIRRWYKDWKPAKGDTPKADGLLYDKLMEVIEKGLGDKKYDTVTFVWMQGERDAKERHGEVYEKSFAGLVKQLSGDLGRDDVNFVIGRLSDCMNKKPGNSHWMEVRKAQVDVAEKNPRGAWV
ncbi:MAG: sialate O-acetylesterase, partial [Opitutales bacterium]